MPEPLVHTAQHAIQHAAAPQPDHSRPWLAHYPEGIDWDQSFVPVPLHQLFEEAAGRYANRPCLDFLGAATATRRC